MACQWLLSVLSLTFVDLSLVGPSECAFLFQRLSCDTCVLLVGCVFHLGPTSLDIFNQLATPLPSSFSFHFFVYIQFNYK